MASTPASYALTMTADGTKSIDSTAAIISAAKARRIFRVQNTHASQILYIGPSGAVTSSAYSWKLVAGASIEIDGYCGALYGYGSGAATTATFLEAY